MASPINRDYWDHLQVASATIIYTHSTDSPSTSITNRYGAEQGSNIQSPSFVLFQLRQQLFKSRCLSVGNEFYRSVMLLLVYLCCFYYCSLDYQNILLAYFTFLAAIAALQDTMSVRNKLSCLEAIMLSLRYCMLFNQFTNHLDVVLATQNTPEVSKKQDRAILPK